jgi:hypothetical protein
MVIEALAHCVRPHLIEFIVYLNQNSKEYEALHFPNTTFLYGPKLSISSMTNKALASSSGEILMYAADDIVFRTKGWDEIVRNSFKNIKHNFGLVYGDDLSPNSPYIATHGFVSKEMSLTLGWLLPPFFRDQFADTYLTRIARISGILNYIPELQIEHMHPNWGKKNLDHTYANHGSKLNFYMNWVRYQFIFPILMRDVYRIRKALKLMEASSIVK